MTPYACLHTLAHLRVSLGIAVSVLLRYALYILLGLAGLAVLLWVGWQILQALAELLAALLFVIALAVMGAR